MFCLPLLSGNLIKTLGSTLSSSQKIYPCSNRLFHMVKGYSVFHKQTLICNIVMSSKWLLRTFMLNAFLTTQNTGYKFSPYLFYFYSVIPVVCSSSSLFYPAILFKYHYTDNQEILIYIKLKPVFHILKIYIREVCEKEMKFLSSLSRYASILVS